jgi:hypothetical protein
MRRLQRILIYTNIPGDGRVNACNASDCRGLSVDAVIVSHLPMRRPRKGSLTVCPGSAPSSIAPFQLLS